MICAGVSTAMMAGWLTIPLAAQEPSSSAPTAKVSTPSAPSGTDLGRRLPNYYGQIGVSPEQRETIYKIVGKHQKKIEALHKQIAEIRSEMMKECESALTDTQKQLLEQRRRISTREQARTSPAPAAPSN
jgi:hypothetical protein